MKGLSWSVALMLLGGCGSDDSQPPNPEPEPPTPTGCVPGERTLENGSCRPAGIIETSCGEGFDHDPVEGCLPSIPLLACEPGMMAVPGDTECRPVSPCPAGRWGELPTGEPITYVDVSFSGGTPDGSESAPYPALFDGIVAAPMGGVVAVAAGAYTGGIGVDKHLRIVGKCAAETTIQGTTDYPAAIAFVEPIANGSALRDVAVTGPTVGLAIDGPTDVVIERVWVHDTGGTGVHLQASQGPTNVLLQDSLVESVTGSGVYASGATLRIERSLIREVSLSGPFGVGVVTQSDGGVRGNTTIVGSVVETTPLLGISYQGADGLVEGTVLRNVVSDNVQASVLSIADQPNVSGSVVTVRKSVVERSGPRGIAVVGSEATIEDVVVRDVYADAGGTGGRGIALENSLVDGRRSLATITGSYVLRAQEVGVFAGGSDVVLESTVVDSTTANPALEGGRGLGIQDDPSFGNPGSGVVRWSRFSRNQQTTIFVAGQTAIIEDTLVEETGLSTDGFWGRGVEVRDDEAGSARGYLELRRVLVDGSIDQGLLVLGADLVAEDVTVRDSQSNPNDGLFGDGIAIATSSQTGVLNPASASLVGLLVQDAHRAGIANFGATVTTSNVTVRCAAFDLAAETHEGLEAVFDNQGGTQCGCGDELSDCKAASASLTPPTPVDEL